MSADPEDPAEPAEPAPSTTTTTTLAESADPDRRSVSPPSTAPSATQRTTTQRVTPGPAGSAAIAGRLGVSGTQVAASVLASVSAAVVTSLCGLAGTIVGAAVVGLVVSLGNAAYSVGIRRTTARMQQLQSLLTEVMTDADAVPGTGGADSGAAAASARRPHGMATAASH